MSSSRAIPRPRGRTRGGFSMTVSCASSKAAGLSTRFIAEGGLVIGRRRLAVFILSALVLLPTIAAAQDGRKLRAGYASLSGNMTPFWAAREAGLFKKYRLDVDLVAFPSGTEGMAAMIAGEIEFLAIAGSTTASAASAAPTSFRWAIRSS